MSWLRPLRDYVKRLSKSTLGQSVIAFTASLYIRFVYATTHWTMIGEHHPAPYWQDDRPMIVCFWHGRLLMVCKAWKGPHAFHMLISGHSDGQVIAKTVGHFGIRWLKGSASKNPKASFKQLMKTLKQGQTVGITPDGPRGPRYRVSPGIVRLAKLTGCDVLPLTFSTSRRRVLSSWDHFLLALPFGRGVMLWGAPLRPSEFQDEESLSAAIETSLNTLTTQTDYDKYLCKLRQLVENAFLHLKRWRGIATRYAKNGDPFSAAVQIRCIDLWYK